MHHPPIPPLETERLQLRCIEAADASSVAELITPAISRWLAHWPIPFTVEMTSNRIETMRTNVAKGDALQYAAIEKRSGKLIGLITVNRDSERPRCGSFSYWLGEKYHGNGYMKELAATIIPHAFQQLKLDVIEAGTQPENAASIKILESCGMQAIGTRMVHASSRKRDELCCFFAIEKSTPTR